MLVRNGTEESCDGCKEEEGIVAGFLKERISNEVGKVFFLLLTLKD
jgi:hypothetical protein